MKYVVTLGSAAVAAFAFAIATPTVATAQPSGNCHESYTPCVPIVSDVDCEGGSGNGPYYTGRVQVIGPDEYGLDRDGDGIACE
ncbi:excalibur calcium-binding domain-containing protein [Nocardia rhizosphaerae]|uniref:Excalibur calcium-binding domain-containing protein n=1 Tax=Nocardia rhizosphaerae TaxID=1691571 RepID=A0ABV8LAB4_9NOCA